MLNRINRWLLAALALQLLVWVAVLGQRWLGAQGPNSEPLLPLAIKDVTELRLDDHSGSEATHLTLTRADAGWQFALNGRVLPVANTQIDTLLQQLSDIQLTWPVTQSGAAAERFETAEDNYRRQLTLVSDDDAYSLYFGTSPGYQQVHGRRADDKAVYALDFDASQLSTDANHWLDKTLLQVDTESLSEVQLDGVTVQRSDDGWQPENVNTAFNASAWLDWLQCWQSLEVSRVISGEDAEALTAEAPILSVDFGVAGQYQLYQNGSQYGVTSSQRDGLFRLGSGTAQALADTEALWQANAEEDDSQP